MMKKITRAILMITVSLITGLTGWAAGAAIGGNYAEQFTFNGLRGYEATGQIGFIIGIAGGLVLSWLVLGRKSETGDKPK